MNRKEPDVAHVYATFLPITSGGVEHHILSISKYVHQFGCRSLLITPRYRCGMRSLPRIDETGFLKIFRVGLIAPPYIKKRFVGPFLNCTVNRFNSLLGAWADKKCVNTDLLHVHSGYFSMELGFNLSRWLSRPFIITLHERLSETSRKNRRILEAAERIVVHREFNRDILEKWGLGCATAFIPMFIDVDRYRKPDDFRSPRKGGIRILSIGRLESRRDPMTLVRAFSDVHRQCPSAELSIIGDGSLRRKVEMLVKRNGLERHAFLEGVQLDVRRYLWLSDIYVSTNTVDDYPSLSLREAMSAGLAVIDTDVGETRKIIRDGKNGLLVPPSDPVALSKAMHTLIKDVKLREEIVRGAKSSSKNFDIRKGIKPLLKIYREVSG